MLYHRSTARWLPLLGVVSILGCTSPAPDEAVALADLAAPAYVQGAVGYTGTGPTVSAALPAAATAGNLIVAYVVWSNAAPITVSDNRGNIYAPVGSGPTAWSGGASAEVFYAKAVSAGATTVTASFASAVSFGIAYANEYSGLDPVNPLDATSAAVGTGTALDSGAAATTGATDLLFGAAASVGAVSSGGAGYTVRTLAEGNLIEDRLVNGAGSYHATAAQGGGGWVMQLVAFRAAQSSGDTTPPAVVIQSPAVGATVSGSVAASGAATDNVGVTKVEWALDAGSYVAASGTASWSFSLDTTTLANGSHTLTVRATDAAGNAGTASVAIVTSNASSTTWPDATNTGVPAGVTLHACASTITATGAYDACLFSGGVSVHADNVTITRSLITGQVDAGDGAQQSGLVIADSTIDCNCPSTDTTHSPAAISYSNFTLQRVNISNSAHGAALGSNVVIQDSYIHGLGGNTEAHKDGIYVGNGTQVALLHNSIECSDGPIAGCTAAIGLLTDFSDITYFTIDNNLLNTNGAYCFYASGGPQKHYRSNHITFTNNHFGNKDNPGCGTFGPVTYYDVTQPGMVWSGNVSDQTGALVPPVY